MNATELMVGDWVVYNGDVDYINPIKIEGMDIATGMCVTTDRDDVGFDGVWPIPLTAEILEKNGFVKSKYGEMILDEELGASEIYLVLEPDYHEEYYWWRVNYEPITKIKNVHELQHILRLSNFDKEIEL